MNIIHKLYKKLVKLLYLDIVMIIQDLERSDIRTILNIVSQSNLDVFRKYSLFLIPIETLIIFFIDLPAIEKHSGRDQFIYYHYLYGHIAMIIGIIFFYLPVVIYKIRKEENINLLIALFSLFTLGLSSFVDSLNFYTNNSMLLFIITVFIQFVMFVYSLRFVLLHIFFSFLIFVFIFGLYNPLDSNAIVSLINISVLLLFAIIAGFLRYRSVIRNLIKTRIIEKQNDKLESQNRVMHDELELAKKVQKAFFTDHDKRKNIASFYQPMHHVGGDFYDFTFFADGQTGFFICDVSGHGVSAAMITSLIKSYFEQNKLNIKDPASFLMGLNDYVFGMTGSNYITALYAIHSPKERRLKFANAGHHPPCMLNTDEITFLKAAKKSIPLAVFNNDSLAKVDKIFFSVEVPVKSGDKVFFYTDGLLEARKRDIHGHLVGKGEFFEEKKFLEVLDRIKDYSCADFIDTLKKELIDYQGGSEFEDDVCLICYEVEKDTDPEELKGN